jgi:CubicO group peptidase (beta-lactamase class C family)
MPFTRRRFLGAASLASTSLVLGNARGAAASSTVAARAQEADRLIASRIKMGDVAAAAFLVRQGGFEVTRAYGAAKIDTPFLVASLTKPMTVSAVMLLRDRRQLALTDPVKQFLPQFTGDGREAITIKHLITHMSGLPDMLPENVELRTRHAPLSEFVERTCRTGLLFQPGGQVRYQSMGILLAAAIVEKIAAQPLPEFLASGVFAPLRMTRTSLGLGGRKIAETAQCQVIEPSDWDWNSAYWRNLAAPWGGAHSTVRDLARFIEAFQVPGSAPWPENSRREMREIQTGSLRPSYGLGWMRDPGAFGQGCSPPTFGHYGSTGTLFWHDPESQVTCVLLTTKPVENSRASVLGPVSDMVAGWP